MTLNIMFSVVGTCEPYPLDSLYIWVGLSLLILEYDKQGAYMKTHPFMNLQNTSFCIEKWS